MLWGFSTSCSADQRTICSNPQLSIRRSLWEPRSTTQAVSSPLSQIRPVNGDVHEIREGYLGSLATSVANHDWIGVRLTGGGSGGKRGGRDPRGELASTRCGVNRLLEA